MDYRKDLKIMRTFNSNKVIFKNKLSGWVSNEYDAIDKICGQYMKTRNGNLYGIISIHRGIVEPKYRSIPCVFELWAYGFCRVQTTDGGWTLINQNGKELTGCCSSRIIIQDENIVFLEDTKGTRVYFPWHRIVSKPYERWKIEGDLIYSYQGPCKGLVLNNGKEIFEPLYKEIYPFGMDTFKAITMGGKEIINKTKWEKPSREADLIHEESNGAFREKTNGRFGYINAANGAPISECRFTEARDFTPSRVALVKLKDRSIGIIDLNGKFVKQI